MVDKFPIKPNDIYVALQADAAAKGRKVFHLTEQQDQAVRASVEQPILVVAGAGSGKTELMAIRVLWLVANQIVKPQDILGLTFTRKAASELAKRINNGLLDLSKTDLWPQSLKEEGYSLPTISTYNSYANNLFRDNAILLGYEPESQLLTEGSAYQLAKSILLEHGNFQGAEFEEADLSLTRAVELTLELAAALNDNLVTAEDVRDEIENFRAELLRITGGAQLGASYIPKVSGAFTTAAVVNLAETYRLEKQKQGYVDYSDQVSLAYRAVARHPEIVRREQELRKVVLLDEYQDTSYLQTALLKTLFADHPVFAVGDPNQSIYGWRGASATNLNEYVEEFSSKPELPVIQLQLSTSWRNPQVVLEAANVIKAPLSQLAPYQVGRGLQATPVDDLHPRPDAERGGIDVLWSEHMVDEAKAVAAWMKERMSSPSGQGFKKPSGAVLVRKKRYMELFVSELQAVGLDVEVVGLGGLLEMPEIIDLVSALRVVHSPNSGGALIRLLAGPRWRIAPKDIARLHRWSKTISKPNDKDLFDKAERSLGAEYDASLVDALDLLAEERKESLYGMSKATLNRLIDAGLLFRELRAHNGLPLVEFVKYVARELHLDVELAANPRRVNPFANLNSFNNIVANYVGSSNGYLGAFLEWLDYVNQNERVEATTTTVRAGAVQVLTVHSAKGLEWDYVSVPAMVETDFPSSPRSKKAWLSAGVLPYALRGDSRSLPELKLDGCTKQAELGHALKTLSDDMETHFEREERRLAYVAITRPKRELLLSGSRWKAHSKDGATTFSKPSRYLLELVDANLQGLRILNADPEGGLPEFESETNPKPLSDIFETWPMDPLGEFHRAKVEAAAKQVNDFFTEPQTADSEGSERPQLAASAPQFDEATAQLIREVGLLVKERDEAEREITEVNLPVRISASRFKDFVKDPGKMADFYARPMPEKPYEATMTGTLFHSWVERKFGFISASDEIDAGAAFEALDETESSADLEQLIENFSKSKWANLTPKEVETEIQVTIHENTFVGKMDAVYEVSNDPDLPGISIEIVDWKTGKSPQTDDEILERSLQLALYRMAYSRKHGIPEDQISVCLYYVAENRELRPTKVLSSKEIIDLWESVLAEFERR